MKHIKAKLVLFLIFIFHLQLISSVTSFDDRPEWLLNKSDFSSIWSFDIDYKIDNRWYFGLNAPNGGFISLETMEFSSLESAVNKVETDLATCYQVHQAGDLIYVFPNYRFVLNAVDDGFGWEIKSPCCYSRGVTFSMENTYIYVFGSQNSDWEDLTYIFNKQTQKLLDYYNRDVNPDIELGIAQYDSIYNQNFDSLISGIILLVILPGSAILIAILPKYTKKMKI